MSLKVEIKKSGKDGKSQLVICADSETELKLDKMNLSPSGKTRRICTSHGNLNTGLEIEGSPVFVSLNAFVYATKR